jgi:hypothetical protein
VAADASNAAALASLAQGSATLINCAAYHRWPEETPALSAALLAAAEQTGAGYINLSNICGYGPVDGLLTDDLPLRPTTIKGRVRAQMYLDGLESRRVRHRPGGRSRAESRPPHPCSGPATRSPQATRRHRSSPTTSKPVLRIQSENICRQSGVLKPIWLEACTVDVVVLGPRAAVFYFDRQPDVIDGNPPRQPPCSPAGCSGGGGGR